MAPEFRPPLGWPHFLYAKMQVRDASDLIISDYQKILQAKHATDRQQPAAWHLENLHQPCWSSQIVPVYLLSRH